MPVSILMPALSPTMTEGNVAKWLKKIGDDIKSGDIIAEVETDKATMEVESIDEGKLAKIIHNDGAENVAVNSLIGIISLEGETEKDVDKYMQEHKVQIVDHNQETKEEIQDRTSVSDNIENFPISDDKNNIVKNQTEETKERDDVIKKVTSRDNSNEKKFQKTNDTDNTVSDKVSKVAISPLAKRIAAIKNININEIKGSGPRGRIVKRDLEEITQNNEIINQSSSVASINNIQEEKKIPLSNIRKTIANKLQASKQTVPHFYLKSNVRAEAIIHARSVLNSLRGTDNKISYNDIIIKSVACALKSVPEMNVTWNTDSIKQFSLVDISVAVATDKGLFTPVIRSACSKSISQISFEMKKFISQAKDNKLLPEDYSGGSFSISNLGMFNVNEFSAIINPPQSGILAVGEIYDTLELSNEKVTSIKMINLVLSVDHRIADGAVAAKFLNKIKFFIESPLGMLL